MGRVFGYLLVGALALTGAQVGPAHASNGAVSEWVTGVWGLMDTDGNLIPYEVTYHLVVTPDGNYNIQYHTTIDNPTGQTIHYNFENTGFLFWIPLYPGAPIDPTQVVMTEDWHILITPNGRVNVSAHFKAP